MKTVFPIILAAGQGTRMRSALPKVLHPIAGKPMLQHVVDACAALGATNIAVVYGHGGDQVRETIHGDVQWALQAEQKGTGHAVAQAIDLAGDDDVVLVAYGDVPLIRQETLQALADATVDHGLVVLTTQLTSPTGYGRIVRDDSGAVPAIIEEKDADDDQRQIQEVNTGSIAACGGDHKRSLK